MANLKYLLPPVAKYFKASLHTHSTVSDGKMTPQQVKEIYKDNGYQILCLTDHHIIADHQALNEEDFLMLTGLEAAVNTEDYAPPKSFTGKCYHLNMIAKEPHNLWQPYAPLKITERNADHAQKASWDPVSYNYSIESVNEMIRQANAHGFLVVYNHPTWSKQNYSEYSQLEGLWGLEIRNTMNCLNGYDDNNHRVYQDMLELGKHLCVVAADDTHRPYSVGGSWTMIGAEKLDYASVIEAMEKGNVYASCGPEILELTLEGDLLRLRCSPAAEVTMQTQARYALRVASEDGSPVTEAEFDLSLWREKSQNWPDAFLRLTVTAPNGRYAVTRAYWLDEL